MAEKTPMRRQYEEIKSRYPDCMLLFRLGDFYEMFDEDAQTAADELDLMLTTRDRNKPPEEQTPMCGVPYHAANSYIKKLIDHGHKVAVCDQLEDPALTKGLVKRDVIRVITPGTVTDEGMLDYERPNYLCALWLDGRRGGAAFCDVSTGEFCAADFPDFAGDHTLNELTRFSPNEAVLSAGAAASRRVTDFITTRVECMYQVEDAGFEYAAAEQQLLHHFGVSSLEELGLAGCEGAVRASGALLGYIGETQKCDMKHISRLDLFEGGRYMELDYATRRSLELTETMRSGEKSGSLLGILDFTKTPMGGRLLRSWVERPLLSAAEIGRRHAAVQELVSDSLRRAELIRAMTGMGDMLRILARVSNGTASPRDLNVLMRAAERVPDMLALLQGSSSALLKNAAAMDSLADVCSDIKAAISDKPNLLVHEGGILREGYCERVARVRSVRDKGTKLITEMEAAERERTGIKRLKIGYNRVYGYYIDVPKTFTGELPEDYVRKQTLVANERYFTAELKQLETELTTAQERVCQLEYKYFCDLRDSIADRVERIQATAEQIAVVDTLCSLAEAAVRYNYCRPEFDLSGTIDIKDGRHPVVERLQKDTLFVPNDAHLDQSDERVLIITGPNMAGKSTYMRQTALIVLMAQMGSFVPARSATLSVVDRVFTRIGGRAEHLHGGDERGGGHTPLRHAQQPHPPRRDRPRHLHLRRHGHSPSRPRILRRQAPPGGQDPLFHPLSRADRPRGPDLRRVQLLHNRAQAGRQPHLPAQGGARCGGRELRHRGRQARRGAGQRHRAREKVPHGAALRRRGPQCAARRACRRRTAQPRRRRGRGGPRTAARRRTGHDVAHRGDEPFV